MEAARLWANRAIMFSTIPRITAPTTSWWYSFSTAYQPAAQGSNAAETGTEHHRDSVYEASKHDAPAGSGASSYAADTAKQGLKKMAIENAKETVYGEDAGGRIEEDATVNEMKKVEQPVDTYEYRSIEEELREKAGGYDLSDHNKN